MPSPECRAARLPWTSVLVLALSSAFVVWRFAAVRTWYWHPDEHDNLVAGWLLARGWRLYADVFSHHMPLPYLWVAAANEVLGTPAPEVQRVAFAGFAAAFLAATWVVFRGRIALLTYVSLELLYALAAPLFLGHAVLADNFFAVGVVPLALYLLFPVPLSQSRAVLLAAAAFVCVSSTAIAVFAVTLAVAVVAWRALRAPARPGRGTHWESAPHAARAGDDGSVAAGSASPALRPWQLAGVFAAPPVLLAGWLAWRGLLAPFVQQAIAFNSQVYGAFLTPPVVQPLDPLRNAAGELVGLVASAARLERWPAADAVDPVAHAFFAFDRAALLAGLCVLVPLALRRPGRAAVWAAFIFLTRLRGGLFHANALYAATLFSLCWPLEAAAARWAQRGRPVARAFAVAPVLLAALGLEYAVWQRWLLAEARANIFQIKQPQERLVRALTRDGERIWVAPLDPLFYLDTQRDPATFAIFYLPWQAAAPAVAERVRSELERSQPPLVIFRAWQPIFGQTPAQYAPSVQRWLDAGYVNLAPLAPQNPWLRDFFLERRRYAEVFGDDPNAPRALPPGLRALLDGGPGGAGSL